MAKKDPAFLFYPNDWLGGTMSMTRAQKGAYIDLLVAQFNSGPLSISAIKQVLGRDFKEWKSLADKFKKDEHGNFFNSRLEDEKSKRKQHAETQRERVNKRWDEYQRIKSGITELDTGTIPNGIPNHIPLSENENGNGKGGPGEKPLIEVFLADLPKSEQFENILRLQGLTREYLLALIPEFRVNGAEPSYPNFNRFATHFSNWVRKNKATAQTSVKSPKPYV